jgi:hypothetical protein|tara:strand:+ start:850 stop:1095 length:246 start_codon:yes stop_codon:yes gene_type:complete
MNKMTPRRAKRYINQAKEWVVFTSEEKSGKHFFRTLISDNAAWEVLLNICVNDYHIRETFRNILNTADEFIENNRDNGEPE